MHGHSSDGLLHGARRSRRWVVGGLLGAIACGGGSGDATAPPASPGGNTTPPPTTPPPSPNAAFLGGWSGATSQGKPLAFHVTENGVAVVMVGWSVTGTGCTDNIVSFLSREPPNSPFAIADGAFTATQTSTTYGTLTLTGTLTAAGTASGSLTMNDTRCVGTLTGTWTATKATGPEVSLAGSWNGTFASSLVSRTNGSFTLTQSDRSVSGTYAVQTGALGTLNGTLSGRTMAFSLTQTTVGCTGTFSGHGVVMPSPETLVYFYSGSDCLGAHTAGSGSATRQ